MTDPVAHVASWLARPRLSSRQWDRNWPLTGGTPPDLVVQCPASAAGLSAAVDGCRADYSWARASVTGDGQITLELWRQRPRQETPPPVSGANLAGPYE